MTYMLFIRTGVSKVRTVCWKHPAKNLVQPADDRMAGLFNVCARLEDK